MNDSPMIREVNRIVANLLIAEGTVCIPDVGTLRVVRRAARRISSKKIEPPYRLVEFSSQPAGASLAAAIARAAGCDATQARDICDRWLARVRVEGTLTIAGVGVLRQTSFTMEASFDELLNPQGHETVTLRSGHGAHWLLWTVAVVAIVCGVGACGWILYDQLCSASAESAAESSAGRNVPVTVETEIGAASVPSDLADRALPDNRQEKALSVVESDGADGSIASARPDAASSEDDWMEAVRLVPGHTYVVLGVYSSLDNARRALWEVERQEPALHCRIYVYGTKYMVSMFSSATSGAGVAFVRSYSDRFPDMWTYRAR